MSKAVILFSGGMDSAVLLHKAIARFDEIHCLTFDYNQRHKREIDTAADLIVHARKKYPKKKIEWKIIDVPFIRHIAPTSSLTNDDIDTPNVNDMMGEAQPASYVPNRNMMFLSIAVANAEGIDADAVWYGAAEVDSLAGYWDSSPEFLDSINNLLNLNRDNRIQVEAPLITLSKKQIILDGIHLGVPFEKTYTCYSGEEVADATSASSSLRLQGFIDAGYKDPIQYAQQDAIEAKYKQNNCKSIS